MSNAIRIKKRAAGGAAGAPTALRSSELAFNEQDSTLYYGFGDDGSANATSIISIGGAGSFATLGTAQTISGNKTFTGSVDLTGATATAATQVAGTNNTSIATTAFVTDAITNAGGYVDPLTTNGDIVIRSGGSTTRLGIGSNNQVLTVVGGLPAWADTANAGTLNIAADGAFSGSVDLDTQTFSVLGGNGITASGSGQTITVGLDNTAVTPGSYGAAGSVSTFTVDAQGRLTAAGSIAISITESQISDLGSYLTSVALNDITDVTITAAAAGEFLRYNGSAWVDATLSAGDIPNLDASKITSGTFADARIAQSNVTQHEGALSITESQISDLGSYLTSVALNDITDVSITAATAGEFLRYNGSAWVDTTLAAGDIPDLDASKITSGTFADARIAQSNVTQHQGALSITESQISDLDSYVSKTATGTESMAGSLTIAGDLTVNGTTTTINTSEVLVEDKNIVLGNVTTPTDATADGGGITLLGSSSKTFNWVNATDAFTSSEHLNLASTKEYKLNGVTVLGYNGATEILDNVEIDGGTF